MTTNNSAQKISLIAVIALGINTVVGSGIWRDIAIWVNIAGPLSLLALTISWLGFLAMAFSFGEIASMFPRSGGPYAFVGGALGDRAGFIFGSLYYIAHVFITSILTILTTGFFMNMFTWTVEPIVLTMLQIMFSVIFITIFAFLPTLLNLKDIVKVFIAFMAFKIGIILIFSYLGFLTFNATLLSDVNFATLFPAMNSTIWALLGIDSILLVAGETKDPEKNIPKAMIYAVTIVFVIYSIFTFSIVGNIELGQYDEINGLSPLAAALDLPVGTLYFIAFLSAIGTTLVMFYITGILLNSMAKDLYMPPKISSFLGESRSRAFLLNWILIMIVIVAFIVDASLIKSNIITTLVGVISIILIVFATAVMAGIIMIYLRLTAIHIKRPFKAPLGILFPVISTLVGLTLIGLVFVGAFDDGGINSISIIIGELILILLILVGTSYAVKSEEAF